MDLQYRELPASDCDPVGIAGIPHEAYGRRRDGRRQKYGKGLCREKDRRDIQGCCRTGRGKGIVTGGRGCPA